MRARPSWFLVVLLLISGLLPAQASRLVVELVTGDSHVYEIDQITAMTFTPDNFRVRTHTQGRLFPVADIAAITFLWTPTGIDDEAAEAALTRISCLLPNKPNPVSVYTAIAFDLPRSGPVQVRVYGVDGSLIRTLLNDDRPMGRHTIDWDGRDTSGRRVANGVYIYRLTLNGIDECRKMVLVR